MADDALAGAFVVDAEAMIAGFHRLPGLASSPELVVPGHDPAVREFFPRIAGETDGACAHRLDAEPAAGLASYLSDLAR